MTKGNNMPKVFLFLIAFAATTVFSAPKFEIFRTIEDFDEHGAVVGCTQKNADKYALKTVVIKDSEGNEKSLQVEICEELNKRGQAYHTIKAKCSYRGCTWTGKEEWYDYDKNGRMTHCKNSNGFEIWVVFDKNGNLLVHTKDNSGFEDWVDYDKNRKRTHYKDSDGKEEWYDKNGNITHSKDSNGREYWYDENGNKIHYKSNVGLEIWYDKNGKMTHYKTSNGGETWLKYDKMGREIYHKNSDGLEIWYDYDENGNKHKTYSKDSDGKEEWYD